MRKPTMVSMTGIKQNFQVTGSPHQNEIVATIVDSTSQKRFFIGEAKNTVMTVQIAVNNRNDSQMIGSRSGREFEKTVLRPKYVSVKAMNVTKFFLEIAGSRRTLSVWGWPVVAMMTTDPSRAEKCSVQRFSRFCTPMLVYMAHGQRVTYTWWAVMIHKRHKATRSLLAVQKRRVVYNALNLDSSLWLPIPAKNLMTACKERTIKQRRGASEKACRKGRAGIIDCLSKISDPIWNSHL